MTSVEVSLRPESEEDFEFLQELFFSVREDDSGFRELIPSARNQLLTEQCHFQHSHYRQKFPQAYFLIIEVAGKRAGRYYINHSPDELRVIDISLLPQYRRYGIGSQLVSRTQEEARHQKLPLRLYARVEDQSDGFYRRLGFVETDRTDSHIAMEWNAL